MRYPKKYIYPSPEDIRSMEEAKRVIRELIDAIETLQQTLYGDIKEIEERLTAGGL